MIADLSGSNVSVYQEVGFLMRLNGGGTNHLILLKNENDGNASEEVGFNLRGIMQVRSNNRGVNKKIKRAINGFSYA